MGEWKTIDSAPKDGTVIDLYGFVIPFGAKPRGYMRQPNVRWSAADDWWVTTPPAQFVAMHPTHWMLPPPPPKG